MGLTLGIRYTRTAIWLHWLIAALIGFNLAFGFFMTDMPQPFRSAVIALHISSGITVLALAVVRIFWRLLHSPPPFTTRTSQLESNAARIVHFLLYVAIFVMPLTGWAFVSAHPPISAARLTLWGIAPLPQMGPIAQIGATPGGVAAQKILHDEIAYWHEAGALMLIFLLLLHIAGALKHQFIDGEQELVRMGIGRLKHPDADPDQSGRPPADRSRTP